MVPVVKEHSENWHRKQTSDMYRRIYLEAHEFMADHLNHHILINDFVIYSASSPRTIQRAFSFHGTTWQKVLKALRMKEAVKLLTNTDESIANISREVGYKNASQFTRTFKKHCGIDPSSFRKLRKESL